MVRDCPAPSPLRVTLPLAAVALACLGVSACSEWAEAETGPPAVSLPPPAERGISALGRLEPEDGIRRVAGPSGSPPVIQRLRVDEGDTVKAGQVLAVLDTAAMRKANIARLEAELENARRELARASELNTSRVMSDSSRDDWETRVSVAAAQLTQAREALDRDYVRAPISGRVLYVHTREGERVGNEGILELGDTANMFAIAEVYEDDVGSVRVGQRARVTSPALPHELSGTVDWVHLKVAKQDTLGTDPAARKDARVVEVEIRLDDSEAAAGLTNLQVEVEIEPVASHPGTTDPASPGA